MPYKTPSTASWKVQELRESVGSRSSQLKIYDRSSKDRGIVRPFPAIIFAKIWHGIGSDVARIYSSQQRRMVTHPVFNMVRQDAYTYIYICISIYAHVAMKTYRSLAELDVEKQMCTLSRPGQATEHDLNNGEPHWKTNGNPSRPVPEP